MDHHTRRGRRDIERVFRWTTVAFAVALLLHGADHLRRGMDVVPHAVMIGGNIQLLFAAITVVLVFTGRRAAPYFAVGVGLLSAIGFTAAHLLPHWGFFSDSFVNAPAWARVTWFSWLTAIIEIAADLALAIRRLSRPGVASTQSRRPYRECADRVSSSDWATMIPAGP